MHLANAVSTLLRWSDPNTAIHGLHEWLSGYHPLASRWVSQLAFGGGLMLHGFLDMQRLGNRFGEPQMAVGAAIVVATSQKIFKVRSELSACSEKLISQQFYDKGRCLVTDATQRLARMEPSGAMSLCTHQGTNSTARPLSADRFLQLFQSRCLYTKIT